MKKPTLEEILEVYKRKNYKIFNNGIPSRNKVMILAHNIPINDKRYEENEK